MEIVSEKGRTAIIYRLKEGLVCKIPWKLDHKRLTAEFKQAIADEKQVLEKLGDHPSIVRYHGPYTIEGEDGLLLGEANCGDLQSYMDREESKINYTLRKRWSLQLAKAVAYVHENGVIHRNLSTANVLLHKTGRSTDIILADFGGSQCLELGLNGTLIPDDPYLDPQLTEFNSPKVDIFSLGVMIYIIMTGHYPFHTRPILKNKEIYVYGASVQKRYQEGKFPDVSNVPFGDVIAGCCCERRFETAKEVVVALEAEM